MDIKPINYLIVMLKNYLKQGECASKTDRETEKESE